MTGSVTRVLSGDTLVVSDGKGELEIRLADIGAPQGSEYYTPASRMLLSNMVSGKTVRVVITGRDGANRAFGRVFVGPLNVNLALVQRAAAWLCIEYATNTDYLPYENDAIRFRRGLWHYTTQFDARNRCRAHPPALQRVGEG
jgi:micrococcal nuclease